MGVFNILSILGITILLVGCGQPGELGLEAPPAGLLSVGDDDETERIIQEQIQNCRLLAGSDQMKSYQQTHRFEDTKIESGRNQVCEFSSNNNEVNGNLSMNDSHLRARYTQNKSLNLPNNAVICDIEIESEEQDFLYDDIFFLNYNNGVLASNHKDKLTQVLSFESFVHSQNQKDISIYSYDWLKLRNTKFDNVANDFCLGQDQGLSRCQWPVTEQTGKIQMKFDPEILIRLSQKKTSLSGQQVSLVITGDDNPDQDCYHQRLDLKFNIKYYLQN